jgi:hypothetical protein
MRRAELSLFSKYPFLAHGRQLEGIPSAQELMSDERYEEARQLGEQRVLGALKGYHGCFLIPSPGFWSPL